MPQLDPSPWLFILLTSWLIFLLFSPTKISKHYFINDPGSKPFKGFNKAWFWPWP